MDSPPSPPASSGPAELADRLGPYRLIRMLGRGGQGTVFLAEDTRLKRRLALKVLTSLTAASPRILERFRREAEMASRLDHPGICTVYDAGVENEVPYIAMRYVEGKSLAQRVASAGRGEATLKIDFDSDSQSGTTTVDDALTSTPPPDREALREAVSIVEKVARALHYAHEVGVIHRDIKPGNIVVSTDGQPVILDFGLARDIASEIGSLTRTGEFFGTPAYMSPEQIAADRALDRRTDVWSLGVTLFEALTCRRPFEAPTREGLYKAILTSEPPDVRKLNPAVPRDLWIVLQTALSKEANRRYQTAAALADDLGAFTQGRPIAAKPVGIVGRTLRWSRRAPAQATLAVLLILGLPLLGAAAAYILPRLAWSWAEDRALAVENSLVEGYVRIVTGELPQAIASFERTLAMDPANTEALVGRALAQLQTGSGGQAVIDLPKTAGAAVQENPALNHLVALALRTAGREAEADELEQSLPPPHTALEHFIVAQKELLRAGAGNPESQERALECARQAVLRSGAPRLVFHTAWCRAAGEAHDPAAAVEAAAITSLHWPRTARARYLAGWALAQSGLRSEALQELQAARELDPNDAATHNDMAALLMGQDRLDAALAEARETVRLDPGYAVGHSTLGHVLVRREEKDEAVLCFRQALRLDPHLAIAHDGLGRLLWAQGARQEAIRELEQAVADDRGSSLLRNRLGSWYLELGRTDEALEILRQAVRMSPEEPACRNSLGNALARKGMFEEAEAEFRKTLQLQPEMVEALTGLGNVLQQQNRIEEAVAAHRRALEIDPNHAASAYNLGTLLMKEGRLEEAVERLARAADLEPDRPEHHCNLGLARRRLGDFPGALEALRRGHELGERLPGWRYPSERWVAETEALVRAEAELDGVLAGATDLPGPDQALELASVAMRARRPVAAAGLYRRLLADHPALSRDLGKEPRLQAAQAAAQAALGQGRDSAALTQEERGAWARQAAAWLREELAFLREEAEAGRLRRDRLLKVLQDLLQDADVAALPGEEAEAVRTEIRRAVRDSPPD